RWAAVLAGAAPPAAALVSPGVGTLPAVAAEMARPVVIADPDRWSSGYGLGLHLVRRRERIFVGHTGSMPGYLAVLFVHRPSRAGIVALANSYSLDGTTIRELGADLLEAVLDHEPAPAGPAWRPSDGAAAAHDLGGRWYWMGRPHDLRW